MTATLAGQPMRALADVPPRMVLRFVHLVVASTMAMYAVGAFVSAEAPVAVAYGWSALTLGTAAAAVLALFAPHARLCRTIVGVGVPLALAWRVYVVVWELVTGDLAFDVGRTLIVLSVYVLGLVIFPLYWSRVVVPLSESERGR